MKKVQRMDSTGYEKMKTDIRATGLDIAEKVCAYADLTQLRVKSKWDDFIRQAPAFIDMYCKTDAKKLNETAQVFHDRSNDPSSLTMAMAWALKSVQLADIYKFNLTLASLQYKLGQKEPAKKTAEHALELGQKAGTDVKPALLLIDKIETSD